MTTDLREQRGIVLAATTKITRYGEHHWKVPSQTGNGFYFVSLVREDHPECNCPGWETRRLTCKHIYATIYTMRREENSDGTTRVTESVAMVATKRRAYGVLGLAWQN